MRQDSHLDVALYKINVVYGWGTSVADIINGEKRDLGTLSHNNVMSFRRSNIRSSLSSSIRNSLF